MEASRSARYPLQAVLALVAALAGGPAHGQGGAPGFPDDVRYAFDSREIALLPGYCKYTQVFSSRVPGGNNPAEIDRWYAIMGPDFKHMHHYCWGLMKTNRALFFTREQRHRNFYLDSAIEEFDYVIRSVESNFVLLPEVLTKKGENMIRLGRGPLAILELQHAIELKADYWPPYAAISDYYKESGQVAEAREWLEKGLSVTPDVKALKTRMADLERTKDKRKSASPQSQEKQTAP
jgi:tetratricopeptide (TPR) repeat protein